MKAMGGLEPNSLTRSHKKGSLSSINLIKEKHSGKLIVSTYADG